MRQTQEECTDEDCVEEGSIGSPGNALMMMTLMGVFALIMFMTRPNSLRPPPPPLNEKPENNDQSGPPPPPLQ